MSHGECSWCNDPAHVRPGRSRREFLYIGLIGGLGLTLGNYNDIHVGDLIETYEMREKPRA